MPRAFEFELEVVLEQRRRIEKDRQRALGQLQALRVASQQRIDQVHDQMRSRQQQLRSILSPEAGVIALDRVRLQTTSGLHSIVLLQRAVLEMAGLNMRVEAARAELLKASIARKAVETLRERRYRAWLMEQNRREAAAADDLNVMRHGRGAESDLAAAATGANP